MEKPWYKSKTLIGAAGYALVVFFEGIASIDPMFALAAKMLTGLLGVYGLRDALG